MKLRGRDVHHRAASIEDGLGMLATATNDLISYEKTSINDLKMNSKISMDSRNVKSQIFHSSQFYPSTLSSEWEYDMNFKKPPPPAATVKPEYIKRYSSAINSNEMR